MRRKTNSVRTIALLACLSSAAALAQDGFVNWENPHVHPLDATPDGLRLLAVNTADGRLEVFDVSSGTPIPAGSVQVGIDPVSVRARTSSEAWVVNHISDSISIVDLISMSVVATLRTDDEPADVVFAGAPQRAYVSCSQANTVLVFDPNDLTAAPQRITLAGEDPRAMAVSADGSEVYVAIFESGNDTTILGGGSTLAGGFPPNVVDEPSGPHGGLNPPPNDGALFRPEQNPDNPPPPPVGMIVRKDELGAWMDDNGGDWTDLVSGANAGLSGRPVGWDLLDHDLAIIDTADHSIVYVPRLMNICMALAVNPASGSVAVVGTDATNEVRFEPVLTGRFLRVNVALVDPLAAAATAIRDLNDHLVYTDDIPFVPIDEVEKLKSIGDPRGIVFASNGARGYISGMGSNNLIVVDHTGARAGISATIPVGEGPTGLVLNEYLRRLFVLNRFAATISVVDIDQEVELGQVPLFDPTPEAIRVGRKHLYDTHLNSGLGHIACASCHVDARMDRLAWDLGDPTGEVRAFNQNCGAGVDNGCEDWHPMKGPMTTQTLQDIIGKEPHHWRGDRDGIEEFADAFRALQGADISLPAIEMQEFEDFLASIHFPPNPFRNFDNSLPTDLPLPGHFTTGRFAPEGQPLPNGNAVTGLSRYRTGQLDGVNCVTCHTLPTGIGTNLRLQGISLTPIPPGPNGELHHALVSVDGSTNVSMKISQLRNLYEKVGFDMTQSQNTAGFGFLHDGSIDTIARFVSEPVFNLTGVQDVANQVAFMLAFAGSDLPVGSATSLVEPLGPTGRDTHAAVGWQTTVLDGSNVPAEQDALIVDMLAEANLNRVGVVVKGLAAGVQRGWVYAGGGTFQSDRAAETISAAGLLASAATGSELTYTVVPFVARTRIGVDRDSDGFLDRDELDACSDPANATSTPSNPGGGDADGDGDVDLADYAELNLCLAGPGIFVSELCVCRFDFDLDGDIDLSDYRELQIAFTGSN